MLPITIRPMLTVSSKRRICSGSRKSLQTHSHELILVANEIELVVRFHPARHFDTSLRFEQSTAASFLDEREHALVVLFWSGRG